MRAISVWQPWALLLVAGFKQIETRPWAAPADAIGEDLAICACKNIRKEQTAAYYDLAFQHHYEATKLPPLGHLPRGAVIGTVKLLDCRPIDDELVSRLDPAEIAFGIYTPGRFAWLVGEPKLFDEPIHASGRLGLWNWKEHEQIRAA